MVKVIPLIRIMIYILRSLTVTGSYKNIYPVEFLVTLLPLYEHTESANLVDCTMYESTEDSNHGFSILYEPTEVFSLKDSVIVNMTTN